MNNGLHLQVGRPAEKGELDAWYAEHGLTPNKDGVFTSMPYEQGPVARDDLLGQIKANAQRHDIPNLHPFEFNPRTFVYVGGGPTLKQFLDDVKAKCEDERYDVYTSNATCKYLLRKGIKPNYHIILDPKESKSKDVDYDEDVPLVLGLQCHPAVFDKSLERGKRIKKFLAASQTGENGITDRECAKEACTPQDNQILGIGGGSMCGTRMMYLAAALGHRRIEYYGFDGSIDYTPEQNVINCYSYFKPRGENVLKTVASNGREFYTTVTMARQGEELPELMDQLPGLDVEIYGDSMLSNQLAIYKEVRKQLSVRITPEYLAMQKQMHSGNTEYGLSGQFSAPRVFMAGAQMLRRNGTCAVLDYGCGQGTLVASIRRAFPDIPGLTYVEYDPAIEVKSAEPRPADVVFCGDVMEHIEPECIDAVLKHIHSLAKSLAILVISLVPAQKNLPDGRNAHICLHKQDWWLSWVRKYFVIVESSVGQTDLTIVCQRLP